MKIILQACRQLDVMDHSIESVLPGVATKIAAVHETVDLSRREQNTWKRNCHSSSRSSLGFPAFHAISVFVYELVMLVIHTFLYPGKQAAIDHLSSYEVEDAVHLAVGEGQPMWVEVREPLKVPVRVCSDLSHRQDREWVVSQTFWVFFR